MTAHAVIVPEELFSVRAWECSHTCVAGENPVRAPSTIQIRVVPVMFSTNHRKVHTKWLKNPCRAFPFLPANDQIKGKCSSASAIQQLRQKKKSGGEKNDHVADSRLEMAGF